MLLFWEFCIWLPETLSPRRSLSVCVVHDQPPSHLYLEMASATGKDAKSIRTAINKLMKAMPQVQTSSSGAADLIVRYGNKLNLPKGLITISQDVAKEATKHLEGCVTISFLGGLLLISFLVNIPQLWQQLVSS